MKKTRALDTRLARVCDQVEHLEKVASEWPGLAAIVAVRSRRELSDDRVTDETRLLSTSVKGLDAGRTGESVRGHGPVENNLNWQLDVSFDENQRRIRKGYRTEKYSRLCRLSPNLLKKDKTVKAGIKSKRLRRVDPRLFAVAEKLNMRLPCWRGCNSSLQFATCHSNLLLSSCAIGGDQSSDDVRGVRFRDRLSVPDADGVGQAGEGVLCAARGLAGKVARAQLSALRHRRTCDGRRSTADNVGRAAESGGCFCRVRCDRFAVVDSRGAAN